MQTPSVSAPARERPPTARLRYLHSALHLMQRCKGLSGQRHTKSQMRKPAIRRDAASRALHNVIRRIRAAVCCCCCCSFSNTTYSKPRRDVPRITGRMGRRRRRRSPQLKPSCILYQSATLRHPLLHTHYMEYWRQSLPRTSSPP